MVITKVTYKHVSGETKTLLLSADETDIALDGCDFSMPGSFVSGYLPEETAIDTLYSAENILDFGSLTEMLFALDKSGFSIVGYSSQEDPANEGGVNGPAANIIDGNTATYWQSEWDAQTAALPHQITVDMGYAWNVFSVELMRRTNNTHTKTIVLEGSTDGDSWNTLGTLNYSTTASENSRILDIPEGKRFRYLRINVTESNSSPYASLSELNVMGKL